jgi:hypothetical protein
MRVINITKRNTNDTDWSIAAAGGTIDIEITLPSDEKIHAIDTMVTCDTADTGSKDITFKLYNIGGQYENFAFWDDSTLIQFSDFYKLVNTNYSAVRVTILNNHAANTLEIKNIHVRVYLYD